MTTKTLIATIILIILFFGTGIFLGTKLKKTTTPGSQENTYEAGWNAAKKQLEQTGVGKTLNQIVAKTIIGTIDTVSGSTIMLKNVSSSDPLSKANLENRTVQIAPDTKVYRLVQKDKTQFLSETEAFQSKVRDRMSGKDNSEDPIVPPQPQSKENATPSDLKAGQFVTITSNEDIADAKEFTAQEINIQFISETLQQANTTTPGVVAPSSAPTTEPTANTALPTQNTPVKPSN
jgi:hypothetical protein